MDLSTAEKSVTMSQTVRTTQHEKRDLKDGPPESRNGILDKSSSKGKVEVGF